MAIAYFALAAAAIEFTRLSGNVALLWIANAPLIAAMLTRPAVERPLHLMACFGATIAASVSVSPYSALSPLFAIANIGEALIAWLLLRRFLGEDRLFASLRSLAIFIAVAGLAAPFITGIIPTLALWMLQGTAPLVIWSNWMLGHGLGALIGTPVALLLIGGTAYRERLARKGEPLRILWVATLVIGITGFCFAQDRLPLLFLPVLPLIVATMIFRLAGAAFGVFAIAMIGAGFTVAGHGPMQLIQGSEAFQLQFFQFYLAVLFLTAHPFATMITEKHRLALAVAESEARYRLIAEHASDAVLTVDPAGDILFASPSVRELAGFDPAALIGKSTFAFIAEGDRERTRAAHKLAIAQPDRIHRFEFRAATASGTIRWFESTARAVTGEDGEVATIVTVIRDLSHRKAREADLERQAATDPMTGVLNRRAFQERLARYRDSGDGPAALALFDLDHFKRVNDSHGHEAGDSALLVFADVLRGNLRSEDVIGRLGGEEFAVLFPGRTASDALAACERVRRSLEDTRIGTPPVSFTITVSTGVAPVRHGETSEAVFRQADAALYRAKALGRNRSELAAG
ncbi:sensor domain-containing diguanylate cyclase [Sphingomonas sp. LT1P40]|uniref:sensor domain-containing diguanylate cyclase n=1 Tax=Alteristakelama amylovorans TaxID=3096166 RepID=UPI002FC9EFC3